MRSVLIRKAGREDADFLAWIILAASRGHLARGWFDIALDQSESRSLEFLRRLSITNAPSWWHYSRFVVAEVAGKPAAALSAFRAGEAYPLSQAAMSETAESLGVPIAEQSAVWQRGAYIFLCAMDGQDDSWTVENIATLPSYRGRGLTTALLARVIEDGRARRLKEAQITFLIGNQPAERTYRKAGFDFAGERRPRVRSGCRGAGPASIRAAALTTRRRSRKLPHSAKILSSPFFLNWDLSKMGK
jgi:ribosomal protein S18 acetylase RimI-like enzyme